jgi:preflagellin peptidase FlaK
MALSGTDASTAIDMARILVGVVALGVASLTDLRTRKVPNVVWYVAAAIGVGLLLADLWSLDGPTSWNLALAIPVAAAFAVVVTGGELWPVMPPDEEDVDRELTPEEARVYVTDLAVSAVLVALSIAVLVLAYDRVKETGAFWHVVSSVMMIVLALGLYLTRLLHGGGDAKALMTLAVLFPIYPLSDTLPLLEMPAGFQLLFPFALGVLINAAIITALAPLAFIIISARRGPLRFPEALFGYPVPIGEVEELQAWLMYEAGEGDERVSRRLWPRRSRQADEARGRALDLLKEQGEDRVYVSPKIPFMVPMLIGLVVTVVVGNIVLGLLWLATGG